MDAHMLLADLRQRGFSLAVRDDEQIVVRPVSRLTEGDCAAIRQCKPELLALLSVASNASPPPAIERAKQIARETEAAGLNLVECATSVGAVELIYVAPREKVVPVNTAFPPCPACNSSRYWISDSGKVVCGSCGETRFVLSSIEFHPIS